MSKTPKTDAAELAVLHPNGLAVVPVFFARILERELIESERDHEQLMNYLTAKLGTKGEHGVFETIDNVAAKLNPKEDEDALHQAWLKSPQGREYLEKLKQQTSWDNKP